MTNLDRRGLIYSAFPGTGKTTVVALAAEQNVVVSDSDSSKFDKSEFPGNYLDHIADTVASGIDILVSSHEDVRRGLVERGLFFTLVYPSKANKKEYMQRYRDRGSPEAFIELMDREFDRFIDSCEAQDGCRHLKLTKGQYLSDVYVIPGPGAE